MYFPEWLGWLAKVESHENGEAQKARKRVIFYEIDLQEEEAGAKLESSNNPGTRGPVYLFNEHILEMRCGLWENKRGLITLLTASFLAPLLAAGFFAAQSAMTIANIHFEKKEASYTGEVFLLIFLGTLAVLMTCFYLKYLLKFSRLEAFTSRHLLIRFNRITKQVHLHRPSYCGGIITLPWDGITSTGSVEKPAHEFGSGLPLMVSWMPQYLGTLHLEAAFVGKPCESDEESRAEWEFIRRFMAEGPENLPRPHITSHFPWPWQAFTPQFEGLGAYFRRSGWVIKLGLLMISPAFLIIGMAHWASLLLCWKPRWPKIIREAGRPGKPVPPLTTLADYPPHIQERLRANAEPIRPGRKPVKKQRSRNGKVDSQA